MKIALIKKGNCFGFSVNYAYWNPRGKNYLGTHLWTITFLFWMWEVSFPEGVRDLYKKEPSHEAHHV